MDYLPYIRTTKNNCLIAPACMCTLNIVRYLMYNIRISLNGAIREYIAKLLVAWL